MKRKLFFLLAATVLCGSAWAYQDATSGLYFRVRGNNATIIATEGAAYTGDIVIPKTVQYVLTIGKKPITITCIVDSIADAAFQSSTITSVKFDTLTNVEHIGSAAFATCRSLKRVEIAEGVKSLGFACFMQSAAVKYYDLPSTLETIDGLAFGSANAAQCDTLICRAATPPTFPGEKAFSYYNIPTFIPCQALDAYRQTAGWDLFTNYNSIVNSYDTIVVDGLRYQIANTGCNSTATLLKYEESAPYAGDIVIPASVESDGLTYYVAAIDTYAFKACNVTSVSFPDDAYSIKTIGEGAFYQSTLPRIVLPEGVEKMGAGVFNTCNKLKSVTLPSTLNSISMYCFKGSILDSIVCLATTPPKCESAPIYSDLPAACRTYVPCQALDAYKAANGWSALTYGDCFTHYWADADIADTTWYNTTDTEFELSTAAQLGGLARLVNEKTDNFKGKTIRLTADINLSNYCWRPISYFEAAKVNDVWDNLFAGTFNGQNHTIDYINGLDQLTSELGIGFFGVINEVTLKNIHLGANCTVENTTVSSVGGLVGQISGDENSAEHTASFIDYCSNAGSVDGNNDVGGLVGAQGGNTYITNCWNTGNVHGENNNVGGIVGYEFESHILNCYNRGTVGGNNDVGGIANHIEGGLIANNYNRASVGIDYMSEENGGCIIGSADHGICAASNYYVSGDIDSGRNEFGTEKTDTWMTDGSMLQALNDSARVYNTANPTKPQLYNWVAGADGYPIIDRPTTGLKDAAANHLNIFAINRQITILDAEGQNMQLFDVMGRIISQKTSIGNFETINVSNGGIYIVRIGNKAQKVAVK